MVTGGNCTHHGTSFLSHGPCLHVRMYASLSETDIALRGDASEKGDTHDTHANRPLSVALNTIPTSASPFGARV
jgi:hypothetical protein